MNKLKAVIFCLLLANASYAADLTQADLNKAAEQQRDSADFMLNKAYEQLMGALEEKEAKADLKAAQKAWLKFRDLNAKFAADQYKGGSLAALTQSQSLTEMTQNRTSALTSQYLSFTTP